MNNTDMYQLLIVDDEIHAVRGIEASVDWKRLSISKVYSAYNIKQAKQIIENNRIDIMICDIEMPQGNGFELLEWVREHYPFIISVLLTCHTEFEYAKKAIYFEILDYLVKPVSPQNLELVIKKAIKKIRQEQEILALKKSYRLFGYSEAQEESLIDKIRWYISQNIVGGLSREVIADKFHLNPDYLNRIFKKETGITISEYIIHEKINAAKYLLVNTKMSVSSIVDLLGYSNFSYFSKLFRTVTGLSPLEYRKKNASVKKKS